MQSTTSETTARPDAGATPSAEDATPGGADWTATVRALGPDFAARAPAHDADDTFVAENYAALKAARVFSAGVPAELGGGGASHAELCAMLNELARHCGSTALSLAMHTHLLAATVWRWRQGQPAEALLRRIVAEQLVLVSTGASDWLDSTGEAVAADGGFRVTARKTFSSGAPAGGLLITTAPYDDPAEGPTVLHFPVAFGSPGVTVQETWRTMGMRATGSHDVLLHDVFVPEGAVSLRRPRGKWHPVYNVVVAVAMPLIMSVYLGVAEAAYDLALRAARRRPNESTPYLVGEMTDALVTARLAVQGMIDLCADYTFPNTIETADAMLVRKTIAARAVIQTAEKAIEVAGGRSFFRSEGLERLFRDIQGARYHPLPEREQQRFTGRLALGLDPVA
jgi:alkylation response protein AidB-like acyl-CoA dehydrogenase